MWRNLIVLELLFSIYCVYEQEHMPTTLWLNYHWYEWMLAIGEIFIFVVVRKWSVSDNFSSSEKQQMISLVPLRTLLFPFWFNSVSSLLTDFVFYKPQYDNLLFTACNAMQCILIVHCNAMCSMQCNAMQRNAFNVLSCSTMFHFAIQCNVLFTLMQLHCVQYILQCNVV